jgi:hypothetical protein
MKLRFPDDSFTPAKSIWWRNDNQDHFWGVVVRVPGYRFRGPGSIPGAASQIFWVVGLERGLLKLVSTIEELLERKSSGSGLKNEITAVGIRHANHVVPSILKSWH